MFISKESTSNNGGVPFLLKKGVKFTWDSECECAFQEFNVVFTSYSTLRYPDFSLPFVLFTDACDTGIEAVLTQEGPDGERTITYAMRSLMPNERKYAVIGKEALAIVWSVKYFRQYLLWNQFYS